MKMLVSAILPVVLAVTSASYGQAPGQDRPAQQKEQAPPSQPQGDESSISVAGCLTKSGEADYVISDSRSGEKTLIISSARLDGYVNQIVRLIGKVSMKGGARVFHPDKVSVLASSCEAADQD